MLGADCTVAPNAASNADCRTRHAFVAYRYRVIPLASREHRSARGQACDASLRNSHRACAPGLMWRAISGRSR